MGGLYLFALVLSAVALLGFAVCIVVAVVFSGALLWRAVFYRLLVVADERVRSFHTRTFVILFVLFALLAPQMVRNPDPLTVLQAAFAYLVLAAGAAVTGLVVARNILITPAELEKRLTRHRPRTAPQGAGAESSAQVEEPDSDRWRWANRKWVYVLLAFPLVWYAILHFAVFQPAGCDMPVVCEQSPHFHVRFLIKSFDTIARISWGAAVAILCVIIVRGIHRHLRARRASLKKSLPGPDERS